MPSEGCNIKKYTKDCHRKLKRCRHKQRNAYKNHKRALRISGRIKQHMYHKKLADNGVTHRQIMVFMCLILVFIMAIHIKWGIYVIGMSKMRPDYS